VRFSAGPYPSERCAQRVAALQAQADAARAAAQTRCDATKRALMRANPSLAHFMRVLLMRVLRCAHLRVRRGGGGAAAAARVWPLLSADVAKRDAVVGAMRHAWGAYEQVMTWQHESMLAWQQCMTARMRG
jgi:hypothetical protein